MKKMLALLLAGAMMISVVACSNSKDGDDDSSEKEGKALAGKTVGFSQTDSMSAWRTTETDSIQKCVEEAGGEFVVKDAQGDIATQASDIADLIALGVDYLRILGYSQLFMCMEILTAGAFSAYGKTLPPSVISILFTSMRIPMAIFLGKTALGLNGVWASISLSSVFKGIVLNPS